MRDGSCLEYLAAEIGRGAGKSEWSKKHREHLIQGQLSVAEKMLMSFGKLLRGQGLCYMADVHQGE